MTKTDVNIARAKAELRKDKDLALMSYELRLGNVMLFTKACGFDRATEAIDRVLRTGRFGWITTPNKTQAKVVRELMLVDSFEGIDSVEDELNVAIELSTSFRLKKEVKWLEDHVLPTLVRE